MSSPSPMVLVGVFCVVQGLVVRLVVMLVYPLRVLHLYLYPHMSCPRSPL